MLKNDFLYFSFQKMSIFNKNKEWKDSGGDLHRLDGPAIEYESGDVEWWVHGKLHRIGGGPAIEWGDKTKMWYINDKLHKMNGPAVKYANGDKEWWVDGELHRIGGPAIEYVDGNKMVVLSW